MWERISPYLVAFAVPLAGALLFTPLVREMNRRLGMIDRPDPRRINKTPIPRGGGLAVYLAALLGTLVMFGAFGNDYFACSAGGYWKYVAVSMFIVAVGYVDDKFSLKPLHKLAGQVVAALLVWAWIGLGFSRVWPALPAGVDCVLTVLWVVGAINAFNLIDGLDGLASGLALIAMIGMAGSHVFLGNAPAMVFYLTMAGALLGFLVYNYNPASVFLGDSGSMFIGFVVATLPLVHPEPGSFLVSIGVPLLAMGVPIFDTSLAIIRRTLRRFLAADDASGEVMHADVDHLHHRILRSVGFSQRKAAWVLYWMAIFLVSVGLVAVNMKSQREGLWLVLLTIGVIVAFQDMVRVEFFDAGRLLGNLAHNRSLAARRRYARLAVPFYMVFDCAVFVTIFFVLVLLSGRQVSRPMVLVALPIRMFATLVALVCFRVYRTVWARAMLSNFMRLFVACFLGAVVGTVGCYYAPGVAAGRLGFTVIAYTVLPFIAFSGVRVMRDVVRDLFYAFDCSRLKARKDVSRIIVYGSGLRYRAFRRELVRTTAANSRMIVGILDDDVLLRGHYIGGIRVLGTINEAVEAINAVNADAVVIACVVSDEWMKVVMDILRPTGVKVTRFTFEEKELSG